MRTLASWLNPPPSSEETAWSFSIRSYVRTRRRRNRNTSVCRRGSPLGERPGR
jgi:hypothetical protein